MLLGPNISDIQIAEHLQDFSVGAVQSLMDFVALKFAPPVSVDKQTASYLVDNIGDFQRDALEPRAPGGAPAWVGFNAALQTYNCAERSVRYPQAREIRDNYPNPMAAMRGATRFLTNLAMINRELEFVDTFLTPTTTWATNTDITATSTTWSDSGATPLEDIDTYILDAVRQTGLKKPNKILFTMDKWIEFKNHPNVTNKLTDTMNRRLDEGRAAELIGVDEVHVLKAIQNTAAEGATDTLVDLETDRVLGVYVNPAADALEGTMTAMKTFIWNRHDRSASNGAPIIITYPHWDGGNTGGGRNTDVYEAKRFDDMSLVSNLRGALLHTI